jgi:hypothetical protein
LVLLVVLPFSKSADPVPRLVTASSMALGAVEQAGVESLVMTSIFLKAEIEFTLHL